MISIILKQKELAKKTKIINQIDVFFKGLRISKFTN